jgi:hypothetical protein
VVALPFLQISFHQSFHRASLTVMGQIGCKTVNYDQFNAKFSEKEQVGEKGLHFD